MRIADLEENVVTNGHHLDHTAKVEVVGVRVPFLQLMGLLIKLGIAAIPTFFVMMAVGFYLLLVLAELMGVPLVID